MQQKSIEWLRAKEYVKKPMLCKDGDRQFVDDPDFERWLTAHDSLKRFSALTIEAPKLNDAGISFVEGMDKEMIMSAPFNAIRGRYIEWHCPWSAVTAIFEGDDRQIYIFVAQPPAT